MTKDQMIEILEENKDLIETNNFEKFYKNVKPPIRPYFTDLFFKSNINPLQYMSYIPERFAACLENIETLDTPKNIIDIEPYAFIRCKNLKSINLPDDIEYIREGAFQDCQSLINLRLPNNLQVIEEYAFYRCSNLNTISIPENLKQIRYSAFYYCDNLRDVYYDGSQYDLYHLYMSSGNGNLLKANIHVNENNYKPVTT